MEPTPANESPRYRSFILSRDQALEKIHRKSQVIITDQVRRLLTRIMEIIAFRHILHGTSGSQRDTVQAVDHSITDAIQVVLQPIVHRILVARKYAYLMAHAGEGEAMRRTGAPTVVAPGVTKNEIRASMDGDMAGSGSIEQRVLLILNKLKREVLDAFEQSLVMGEPLPDTLRRVSRNFPDVRKQDKVRRVLRPPKLTEADNPTWEADHEFRAYIPPDEWQEMIRDYQEEYIPKWRGPEHAYPYASAQDPKKDEWYAWELEQQTAHDFVEKVRQGQNDAAKASGITDFLWISIIDSKTDDCCYWRSGLSTSEIRAALEKEHKDDECDAEVPPAHFNCRCTMAPLLEGMPEESPPDYGDFDEWLNDVTITQTTRP
jgi:hypothetical protein